MGYVVKRRDKVERQVAAYRQRGVLTEVGIYAPAVFTAGGIEYCKCFTYTYVGTYIYQPKYLCARNLCNLHCFICLML